MSKCVPHLLNAEDEPKAKRARVESEESTVAWDYLPMDLWVMHIGRDLLLNHSFRKMHGHHPGCHCDCGWNNWYSLAHANKALWAALPVDAVRILQHEDLAECMNPPGLSIPFWRICIAAIRHEASCDAIDRLSRIIDDQRCGIPELGHYFYALCDVHDEAQLEKSLSVLQDHANDRYVQDDPLTVDPRMLLDIYELGRHDLVAKIVDRFLYLIPESVTSIFKTIAFAVLTTSHSKRGLHRDILEHKAQVEAILLHIFPRKKTTKRRVLQWTHLWIAIYGPKSDPGWVARIQDAYIVIPDSSSGRWISVPGFDLRRALDALMMDQWTLSQAERRQVYRLLAMYLETMTGVHFEAQWHPFYEFILSDARLWDVYIYQRRNGHGVFNGVFVIPFTNEELDAFLAIFCEKRLPIDLGTLVRSVPKDQYPIVAKYKDRLRLCDNSDRRDYQNNILPHL